MKKVLVISFNCFSSSSSNGRALGSLLKLSDELLISQIYIKNGEPDFVSGNYCFINENQLPRKKFNIKKCVSFFNFNNSNKQCVKTTLVSDLNGAQKIVKTPFKMFLRNIAWSFASKSLKIIYEWADNIKPDYILIQAGDLPFLFFLGKKMAERYGSKIVFYTSENYPFKKHNYTNLGKNSLIYPLLRKKLYNATKEIVEKAYSCIFLTESLKKEYSINYSISGKKYVLYPCSDIGELSPRKKNEQYIFSYCGNLALGRDKTLIEIAKILELYYPNCKLIVCGKCSESMLQMFKEISIIDYFGVVSYQDVIKIYEKSDFIMHVEGFNELIADDSKHAFSGKIADCISTCRPFIFVGPNKMYEFQFLESTKSALVFDSIDSFGDEISSGILERYSFDINNQRSVKEKFFSKNKTQHIIEEIFEI